MVLDFLFLILFTGLRVVAFLIVIDTNLECHWPKWNKNKYIWEKRNIKMILWQSIWFYKRHLCHLLCQERYSWNCSHIAVAMESLHCCSLACLQVQLSLRGSSSSSGGLGLSLLARAAILALVSMKQLDIPFLSIMILWSTASASTKSRWVSKLYLSGWTKMGKRFFQVPKVRSTTFQSIECWRLNSSFLVSGLDQVINL